MIHREGKHIVLSGLASAHSHAFQRALRARTQRRQTAAGSFWSWRDLMYELAAKLDPEDVFHISRFAFIELALSGVTAVGEFHYLHHQPDGTPYDDRVTMAEAVIHAAQAAGVRITLIRTAYFRGGFQQELTAAQKRFTDESVDAVLRDVETLQTRHRTDETVSVAVAAHSLRAVPIPAVRELAAWADKNQMPFHMHVAEQRRELEECSQEYGTTPVALLAREGVLNDRFVAVHATHLSAEEIQALGDAKALVCLCRTTERDLGDGLPQARELIEAGARICVGVDSHASSDGFEELRAVELDERSRTEARAVAAEADELYTFATTNGFQAIGMEEAVDCDRVLLDAEDPSLALVEDELLPDAVVFAATPRAVREVVVAGQSVVHEGRHKDYDEALRGFRRTLVRLGLLPAA